MGGEEGTVAIALEDGDESVCSFFSPAIPRVGEYIEVSEGIGREKVTHIYKVMDKEPVWRVMNSRLRTVFVFVQKER